MRVCCNGPARAAASPADDVTTPRGSDGRRARRLRGLHHSPPRLSPSSHNCHPETAWFWPRAELRAPWEAGPASCLSPAPEAGQVWPRPLLSPGLCLPPPLTRPLVWPVLARRLGGPGPRCLRDPCRPAAPGHSTPGPSGSQTASLIGYKIS